MNKIIQGLVAALRSPGAIFLFACGMCLVAWSLFLDADSSTTDKIIFAVITCAIIYSAQALFRSKSYYTTKVRLAAIGAASLATAAYFFAQNSLWIFLASIANDKFGLSLPTAAGAPSAINAVVVLVIWGAALLIVYITNDQSAMSVNPNKLETTPGEVSFHEHLQTAKKLLCEHLDRLDSETDWTHRHFAPLNAEIEVAQDGYSSRRAADLISGLRRESAPLVLVLGDPGSGKSVALRKLARDLLGESEETNRLPIYLNLREWTAHHEWTRDNPPKSADFRRFVLASLRHRFPTSTFRIIENHFDRLHLGGNLYFILDSFDEIPVVLDSDESAWIIKELSALLTQFILGGRQSRGIISSRLYRAPVVTSSTVARFEILPFTDKQISKVVDRQLGERAVLLKRGIFTGAAALQRMARSPFLLGLLIAYVDRNGRMPDNQAALFESYVSHSMLDAVEALRDRSLSEATVRAVAEGVAHVMFESDLRGLEIELSTVERKLPSLPVVAALEFLAEARIGRISNRMFSFVHRRFNEYFLVRALLTAPKKAPLDAIPADSRWRDAMVLYAEVADSRDARRIARFCIVQARDLLRFEVRAGHAKYRRGLHCLRFLADAFRGRPWLVGHLSILERFVFSALYGHDNDILVAKHAVETTGLLRSDAAEAALTAGIESKNWWVSNTAVRATRFLPSANHELLDAIRRFLIFSDEWSILTDQHNIRQSFGLSPALMPLARFLQVLRVAYVLFVVWVVLVLLFVPVLAGFYVVIGWVSCVSGTSGRMIRMKGCLARSEREQLRRPC